MQDYLIQKVLGEMCSAPTEASQICPSKRQSKKSSADFALGQLPANHPKKDFAEKSEEGELPTLASH